LRILCFWSHARRRCSCHFCKKSFRSFTRSIGNDTRSTRFCRRLTISGFRS